MKIAARTITEAPSETSRTGLPNHARLPIMAQSPCGHAATANIEGLIERNDLAGLQTAYMTQFPDDALSLFINLLNPNG